jgi:glycosyltransferase involved in cell wall biosynthesis
MKVSLSIYGRFHFFDIAQQLHSKKLLNQLITSYPSAKVKEWGIPSNKINTLVPLEIIRRLFSKLKIYSKSSDLVFKRTYGFFSKMILKEDVDIFICFAGNGFNSTILHSLKSKNTICIVEEGSSHINEHIQILEDEEKCLGINFYVNKPKKESVKETLLEYSLADYISVPSSFVKRSFIKQGIPEKKLLINPYAVNLSSFKQVEKKDDIFRIIFTGTIGFRKGFHYLLQAFDELKHLENIELMAIGNISSEIQPFVDKYNNDKIKYIGTVKFDDLYKYYSQGSVFVLPSIEEGFALVQFQAMACGLPLICTTNTGGEDLISNDGEEGFVVPIREVEMLKEKILFTYNNQSITKKMGEKAKQKVSKNFNWETYGDRYIETLKKIARERNVI